MVGFRPVFMGNPLTSAAIRCRVRQFLVGSTGRIERPGLCYYHFESTSFCPVLYIVVIVDEGSTHIYHKECKTVSYIFVIDAY